MESDFSELSSMASTLEQLIRRFSSLADQAIARKQDDVAADLLAVERALTSAQRRLGRLLSPRN
jgi:hypothetical protein